MTLSTPTAASSPTSRTPIREPAARIGSPTAMSSPVRRMCCPTELGTVMVTSALPRSVASYGTIASASAGTGAPVMIFIAVPGESRCGAAPPAGTSPTTGRRTGRTSVAYWTSAARTAYPSMAELSKRGSASEETTSSQMLRPSASRTCWPNGISSSTAESR